MNPKNREETRRIFRQELFTLREEGYLSEAIVETVAKAHHQYDLDLLEIKAQQHQAEIIEPTPKPVPPKPPKVKKTRTPEEIRERNITWSLNIGVIFLLIGGLFVATSNWESMTSIMKSGSIAIVSLLFYGIALLTKKVLHIDKTAFAFTVLGSLFLPIFILSLGWFGLLGSYLSINGEGRYFLGMLGSFLPIIVYFLFARKLNSRLFVWFTYVSLSAGAAFLLAGIKLKIDFFYLGLVVFNTLLIWGYQWVKGKDSFILFSKEFTPYIQVNLILSTLFMLFIYDSELLYSVNLLLTAIIYLGMMYVSGRKEYHFIFTLMVVYGAYQLIEHSFLEYFAQACYALIAFGFVFVPKVLDNRFSLNKVFQYTSAVISGFAFIYISIEGIMLRAGSPSLVLMIAYFIIAANFIYLSFNSSIRLFPYLSSLFMASAIYEAIALITQPLDGINFSLSLCITGFILFTVFGFAHLGPYLKIIQTASRDLGVAIIAFSIMISMLFTLWWELGVMLLLLVVAAYLIFKNELRRILKDAALWILSPALGLSAVAFGEEINTISLSYYLEYGEAINFAAGAALLLGTSLVWRKVGEKQLTSISLYTAQALYTLAIIHAWLSPINQTWVQPLVLIIGIFMYYYLYKKISTKWVPFFISITSLLLYFSVFHAISQEFLFSHLVNSLIVPTSALFLLIIAYLCRKRDMDMANAFAWVGHSLYPIALTFTLFAYHTDAVYSFIPALFAYALSSRLAVKEWKVKVCLYGCFTSLFLSISTGMDSTIFQITGQYEFPITSGLLLIFAFLAQDEFKTRTAYYLVPFSIIGLGCMLFTYPFGVLPYLVTCGYTIGILFYLHKIKWDLLGFLPLFLVFIATVEFSYLSEMDEFVKLVLTGGLGILMMIIGQIVYKNLFANGKKLQETTIDGYTVISFLFFWLMYFFESQHLWTHALPGTLIAVSFWLQRKRVPSSISSFMPILGGAYLLQPYYSIINDLNILPLWEREVRVLPFIILVIFIRKSLHGQYADITKAIQWGVLVIVSLILIQDGLASNTIYDAIILGSLSLLSMLSGMFLHIKSYFFVGAGVLLLNVFLQTRPYWGNMPWWVYLLIAGLILITVASFNEWNKQKVQKGEKTFINSLKGKVMVTLKKWN